MSTKQDVFENKNERNDFIIALIVIAVFSVFVFMLLKKGTPENGLLQKDVLVEDTNIIADTANITNKTILKDNQENKIVNSKNNTTSTVNSSSSLAAANFNKDTKSDTTSPTEDKTVEKVEIVAPAVIKKTVDIIKTKSIENKEKTIDEVNNSTIETKNQHKETIVEKATEAIADDTAKVATEVITKAETQEQTTAYNTSTEDCVIVVGVYRDEINLNKTLKKLEDSGFSSTSGALNSSGLYYAGVPIQCNENKLETKMNKLNTIFSVTSWLHKK